jgi:hypothetical protein
VCQWARRNPAAPRRNVGGTPKNKWTPEEDALLEQSVLELGQDAWRDVAGRIAGRNSKQCRERWMGHMDPAISREDWTPDEDMTLVTKQSQIGNQWAQIKQFLPGRSLLAVKNRWIWLSRREVPRHSHEFLQIVASHEGEAAPATDPEAGWFPTFDSFEVWDETGIFPSLE